MIIYERVRSAVDEEQGYKVKDQRLYRGVNHELYLKPPEPAHGHRSTSKWVPGTLSFITSLSLGMILCFCKAQPDLSIKPDYEKHIINISWILSITQTAFYSEKSRYSAIPSEIALDHPDFYNCDCALPYTIYFTKDNYHDFSCHHYDLPSGLLPYVNKDDYNIIFVGNIDFDEYLDVYKLNEKWHLIHIYSDNKNRTINMKLIIGPPQL